MPNYVPPEGSLDARIVLVGEAPGKWENLRQRPFVGPSWEEKLRPWIEAAGLSRKDLYITNVHKYQPKANKIETVPRSALAQSVDALLDELAVLSRPFVLVPTGNTALRATTGKSLITRWRGSIFTTTDKLGRNIKVIPTIHPAATFRSPYLEKRCRRDWQRIAEESHTPEVSLPQREHFVNPTLEDVLAFHAEALAAPAISVDIETPRKITTEFVRLLKSGKRKGQPLYKKVRNQRHLAMVGFATSPSFSFTIPTTIGYWKDQETLDRVWQLIREICEAPSEKILTNGMFDQFWLARDKGIWLNNYRWDCLAMHHCIDSNDDHDLAYMASVDTREPYWKSSGKDNDEDDDDPEASSPQDFTAYQVYNGKDCCVEYELADIYAGQLTDLGLHDFYEDHYRSLIKPLLAITMHGVAVDMSRMKIGYAKQQAKCIAIQDQLAQLAGKPLHTKKSLSTKKITEYLYEDLKLPKVYKTGKAAGGQHKVTVDEIALRRMANRHKANQLAFQSISLILDHRREYQVCTFLQSEKCDSDNRMRCTYKFTTEFNRLASSSNPFGTGRNLQNIDRAVLDCFIADEGCVLLECDLSQAEDRVVKVLAYNVTGDNSVLDRARAMPWENDEHKRAASAVFHTPLDQVTKAQRYFGKRVRHSSNYDAQGARLSDEFLKEGYTFTPEECQEMIDTLRRVDTYIVEYQRDVRRKIIEHRSLSNSWGRIFDFQYERLDGNTYRRGYAAIPQSEVGIIVNQWGLKPLHKYIQDNNLQSRINMQVHDALKVSCPPSEVAAVATLLKQSLERRRQYGPTWLSIPCEFKLGLTAAGQVEFKRFDAKAIEEAAYAIIKGENVAA